MGWKLMPEQCSRVKIHASGLYTAGHTRETPSTAASGIISKRILHLIRAQLLHLHSRAAATARSAVTKCTREIYQSMHAIPQPTCSGHKEAIMVINNCIAALTSGQRNEIHLCVCAIIFPSISMLNISRSAISVQLGPRGRKSRTTCRTTFTSTLCVCDAIVWLFSSARTEYIPVRRRQHHTIQRQHLLPRRHYYIFQPAGALTSTC